MLLVAPNNKKPWRLAPLPIGQRQLCIYDTSSFQLLQTEETAAYQLILVISTFLAVIIINLDPVNLTLIMTQDFPVTNYYINFRSLSYPFNSDSVKRKSFQFGLRVFFLVSEVRIFVNPPEGFGLEMTT